MDIITVVTLATTVLSTLILALTLYTLRRLLAALELLRRDNKSGQNSTEKILLSGTADILQALKEQKIDRDAFTNHPPGGDK
ncbi:MAG: hypothetical protein M3348_01375 [Acidobacteriota bacterium]|nr:hypothetical protein [Acidobacteriota bacterium]